MTTERRSSRPRDERGFVAIEFVLGVGLLLFPVLILVTSLPKWSERETMARTAATEAARAWARADNDLEGAVAARRMVDEIARNYGVDPTSLTTRFAGSVRVRGGKVDVTVSVEMPVEAVPGVGSLGGWHWSTSHTESVDRYRSYG
jgi:Flp pilus assembly protein TadG